MKTICFFFLFPLFVLFLSCSTSKPRNVIYFPTLQDSLLNAQVDEVDFPIANSDILAISVSGLDPEVTALLNKSSQGSSSSGSGSSGGGSYLVSKDGFIQFPFVGQIKAAGLTKKELATSISKQLIGKKLLLDPIVSVRQENFHITVLGEVGRPGVYPVPSEQINILEAIGTAGDITLQGKKDNVLLIRQEGGRKVSKRLDLSSSSIFTSPYYELHSNDIVYVEPSERKVKTVDAKPSILPIVLSAASFLFFVFDRIVN